MKWTTDSHIIEKIAKAWGSGEILRAIGGAEGATPLLIRIVGPSPKELTADLARARQWASALGAGKPYVILKAPVANRLHGTQLMPSCAEVSIEAALQCLGQPPETVGVFQEVLDKLEEQSPQLHQWAMQEPGKALAISADLDALLRALTWMLANPAPQVYLRQITAAGVHTKLIERHRATLAKWLDISLPASAINADHTGVEGFNLRYGLRVPPTFVRCRSLDPACTIITADATADLQVTAESFAGLDLPCFRTVIITENLTNYLCLPVMTGCLAIFGGGYCWGAISRATWLNERKIIYWGDIDTHGFHILSQLRAHFPHTVSVLMDMTTIQENRAFGGQEQAPARRPPSNLSEAEQEVYEAIDAGGNMAGLRIEQEHIYFDHAVERLRAAITGA